jgi:hypothetical protein
VRNALPVSLILAKLSKSVKEPLTSVNNTGEEFLTGINDIGETNFTGVVDTSKAPNLSNISANNRKKSKLFLGLSIGTKRSSLTKKPKLKNLVTLSL